jgi:hypothetical protein
LRLGVVAVSLRFVPLSEYGVNLEVVIKRNLCHMLGIEYSIIAAPMGPDLIGPELVAA